MDKWRIARSRVILDRAPWLRVTEQRVELPQGGIIDDYLLVRERDVVLVFAVTDGADVLFVEQYKHGVGESMWALPAGYLDDTDASPMQAAGRELAEETGYTGGEWDHLASLVLNSNRWNNRLHFFLARGVRRTCAQHLDPTESITVHRVPLGHVARIVGREIDEVGSATGILLALRRLEGDRSTNPHE